MLKITGVSVPNKTRSPEVSSWSLKHGKMFKLMPQRCLLVKTSHAGPTEASPGRRGQSTAASMPFAGFLPCLSPCSRHLCLISQSPVNGQPKALLLGYSEQLLKEVELEIVPMSLPPPSNVCSFSVLSQSS